MAQLIRVTEDTVTTTHVNPANGKTFTLQELQRMVGGFIEALDLQNGFVMWLNEEGKLKGLPYNPVAHAIAMRAGLPAHDYVVGNVLIASRAETEGDEEED